MTTETTDSVAGNRRWRDRVPMDGGTVEVSTLRPWLTNGVQADHYETCLFPLSGGMSRTVPSLVVHTYDDETQARVGHGAWTDGENIASALMHAVRGTWEVCYTAGRDNHE